jgi:hypothetical protein
MIVIRPVSDVAVEVALGINIEASINGDAKAGFTAALLIYSFPSVAKKCGLDAQYERLVRLALNLEDAELLVCIAEELVRGKLLAKNVKLASQMLKRADRLSPFLAAYVMGQSVASTNEALAISFFKKAQDAGHIASMFARHRLLVKRMSILGPPLRLFFFFVHFYTIWQALNEGDRLNEKFWRYRDFYKNPPAHITKQIGSDRANPFADILAFAGVIKAPSVSGHGNPSCLQ